MFSFPAFYFRLLLSGLLKSPPWIFFFPPLLFSPRSDWGMVSLVDHQALWMPPSLSQAYIQCVSCPGATLTPGALNWLCQQHDWLFLRADLNSIKHPSAAVLAQTHSLDSTSTSTLSRQLRLFCNKCNPARARWCYKKRQTISHKTNSAQMWWMDKWRYC